MTRTPVCNRVALRLERRDEHPARPISSQRGNRM